MKTNRLIRACAPLLLVALLAGCATGPRQIPTEVTAFNEFGALPTDRSYVFARTLEFQNSLELSSYEDVVRDELAIQGFRLATDPARANLTVTLRPSVSSTRIRVRDPWPDPFWRYGGYRGFGGFGGFGHRGFGWYDPYWSTYSSFNDYSVDVFRRRLEIDIDSRSVAGKRYYEGRVESTGQSDSLQSVVPYLVRALFSEFPGNNGQTRRVDVPVDTVPETTK